jgi:hypothetical protein
MDRRGAIASTIQATINVKEMMLVTLLCDRHQVSSSSFAHKMFCKARDTFAIQEHFLCNVRNLVRVLLAGVKSAIE